MAKFVLAVFLIELTPGPNMAYLATLALVRGRIAGLLATAGVAVGLSVHAAVAALGAGELLRLYPWLYEILRWIGIAYFLFLAWDGWQTSGDSPSQHDFQSAPGTLLLRGFLTNAFNPKSLLFFISVVPTFVRLEPGHPDYPTAIAALGGIYIGVATLVHATIVVIAAQVSPWLQDEKRRKLVRRGLAVALVFVAFWLAWATRR